MNRDSTDEQQLQVLIVDDVPANLRVLRDALEPRGYSILIASHGKAALSIAQRTNPDLILLDVMMPGMDGFEVCRRLKQDRNTTDIPVMFITARDDTESIVEGFRVGGVDYLSRPFREAEVVVRVENHLKTYRLTRQLLQKNRELQEEIARRERTESELARADGQLAGLSQQEAERWNIEGFIGQSKTVAAIMEDVRQLQRTDNMNVLIMGESGTGKELIARAIHFGGTRARRPFVPVNCSAIPYELAESMLFGYVRGAFTGARDTRRGYFELADRGTLFLDEIGDMPLDLQAKLLRVLEDGSFTPVGSTTQKRVDVRVVSATNQDVQVQTAQGVFRQDLYFRLAPFTVDVPPLRERPEDIPLLIQHFLKLLATEMGIETPGLSPATFSALSRYTFPGNVRELKNMIEYALIKSKGSMIQPEHLHFIPANPPVSPSPMTLHQSSPTDHSPLPPETDEDRILLHLQSHRSINNAECRDLLDVDLHRASYLLRKMHRACLLTRQGGHRGARYYVNS